MLSTNWRPYAPDFQAERSCQADMSGCSHSRQASRKTVENYSLGVRLSLALILRRTDFQPICPVCSSRDVFVCLDCSHVGCMAHAAHDNHDLAVCLWADNPGYLFCTADNDFVFDGKFEELRKKEIESMLLGNDRMPNGTAKGDANGSAGTLHGANGHANGSAADTLALKNRPPYHATLGIRGFLNMGATCYMAVILQSMVHNPLVRDFFLSGGHDSAVCPRKYCVMCSIDRVFVNFFSSSEVLGYGMADLLVAVAKTNTRSLIGATDQDAHEFLQFLLDQFDSAHFESNTTGRASQLLQLPTPSPEEESIAQRTFAGEMESTLTCESCGSIHHTTDPMMDLSLELDGTTLKQCLDGFTKREKLTHYRCSQCSEMGTVTKRMLIKRLPPILQIQLKRFKHTATGVARKDESPVAYNLQLDLTPYTTKPDTSRPLLYELYGVVRHQGSLDSGHYTCAMKHFRGTWYYYNDEVVTPISPAQVLSTSAYLLFYTTKWAV